MRARDLGGFSFCALENASVGAVGWLMGAAAPCMSVGRLMRSPCHFDCPPATRIHDASLVSLCPGRAFTIRAYMDCPSATHCDQLPLALCGSVHIHRRRVTSCSLMPSGFRRGMSLDVSLRVVEALVVGEAFVLFRISV